MTVHEVLDRSGLERHEAERLAMVVTGLDRSGLLALSSLTENERSRFHLLADRRRAGEPLQYLEEEVPFGPVTVLVDPRVLIPRPETEYLWELASQRTDPGVVVDLCTGSGALALSAKHGWPDAEVYGTDLSGDALEVARSNAARLGLAVQWKQGDLFAALDPTLRGRIGLILTNPPYVADDEYDDLPSEVREHEPREALLGGRHGMEVVETIAKEAGAWLRTGGVIWCEIGETQGAMALEAFEGLDAEVVKDLTGRDRFVHGVKR